MRRLARTVLCTKAQYGAKLGTSPLFHRNGTIKLENYLHSNVPLGSKLRLGILMYPIIRRRFALWKESSIVIGVHYLPLETFVQRPRKIDVPINLLFDRSEAMDCSKVRKYFYSGVWISKTQMHTWSYFNKLGYLHEWAIDIPSCGKGRKCRILGFAYFVL